MPYFCLTEIRYARFNSFSYQQKHVVHQQYEKNLFHLRPATFFCSEMLEILLSSDAQMKVKKEAEKKKKN